MTVCLDVWYNVYMYRDLEGSNHLFIPLDMRTNKNYNTVLMRYIQNYCDRDYFHCTMPNMIHHPILTDLICYTSLFILNENQFSPSLQFRYHRPRPSPHPYHPTDDLRGSVQ